MKTSAFFLILLLGTFHFGCLLASNSRKVSSQGLTYSSETTEEGKLIDTLLEIYPVSGLTRPHPPWTITNVTLSLTINKFNGIDDLQETMSFSGLIIVKWTDNYLRWNMRVHPVSVVHLRFRDVWLPVILQTSAPGNIDPIINSDSNRNSDVLKVTNTGNVMAVGAGAWETQCTLDLTDFPFDIQTCSYTFQVVSYTYDLLQIVAADPAYTAVDTNSAFSAQWVIISVSNQSGLTYFQSNPFSSLTYSVTAKRRRTFYTMNVLLPCVLMAFLALGTFLFPFEDSRAVYSITVVLGLAVYQTLITTELPRTAARISLVLYIIGEMVIASIISFYSAVITFFFERLASSGTPVPPYLAHLNPLYTFYPVQRHTIPKKDFSGQEPHRQAAARIINKLENDRADRKYYKDWARFLNTVDILVFISAIFISILLPVLIFKTHLLTSSGNDATSPVPTNYVEHYYSLTYKEKGFQHNGTLRNHTGRPPNRRG